MVENGSIWSRNKHIYSLVSLFDSRLVSQAIFWHCRSRISFCATQAFKANLVLGAVTCCTELRKVLVATTDPSLLPHLTTDVLLICGLIYPIWVWRGVIDSKCKAELKFFTPVLQFLLWPKSYFFPFSAVTLIVVAVVWMPALPVSLLGGYLTCVTCKQLFVLNKSWTNHSAQKPHDCLNRWGIKVLSLMNLTQTVGRMKKKTPFILHLFLLSLWLSHTPRVC